MLLKSYNDEEGRLSPDQMKAQEISDVYYNVDIDKTPTYSDMTWIELKKMSDYGSCQEGCEYPISIQNENGRLILRLWNSAIELDASNEDFERAFDITDCFGD